MNTLFLITARSGSKGIPHKNIKLFNGKPLIVYAIDQARHFAKDEDICVSTDGQEIIHVVEEYGLHVPFVRPQKLASDTAGSYEVIMHALQFYENQGKMYNRIVLLQPTSPFRRIEDIEATMKIYNESLEIAVSVKPASANPYYDIFEPDTNGYLKISKGDGMITRRQEAPKCYEYNGAVYVMNVAALKAHHTSEFDRVAFYEMDELHSLDLDTMLDWKYAELLVKEGLVK